MLKNKKVNCSGLLVWMYIACLPHRRQRGIKGGEWVGTMERRKIPPLKRKAFLTPRTWLRRRLWQLVPKLPNASPRRGRWGKPIVRANTYILILSCLLFFAPLPLAAGDEKPVELLHVSYDVTRELFQEINALYEAGHNVKINMSHAGSGKQARAVMDGLPADIVTLALPYDIDVLAERTDLVSKNWRGEFPNGAVPFSSTIVFLVRKGNPKNIRDWNDLTRGDVKIVAPNPQVSGGARWIYLAAWGYAVKRMNADEVAAKEFIKKLYSHVPVLDAGARASTMTFVQRGQGDVLLAWENEAHIAASKDKGKFEIVNPSLSISAQAVVAVVKAKQKRKQNLDAAREYVNFLFTEEAQAIVLKHYLRPAADKVRQDNMELFQMEEIFGDWKTAQARHFDKGGIFDEIYSGK